MLSRVGLSDSSLATPCGPGARGHDKRFIGEAFAAQLPQPCPSVWVEAGGVAAGGPDAERERLPPLLECRMLDAHREEHGFDLAQACRLEQLLQVPLSRARKIGFVLNLGVENARRFPERAERPPAAGMIPDAGSDKALRAGHARHLRQPGDRVSHEVNDELRHDRVE